MKCKSSRSVTKTYIRTLQVVPCLPSQKIIILQECNLQRSLILTFVPNLHNVYYYCIPYTVNEFHRNVNRSPHHTGCCLQLLPRLLSLTQINTNLSSGFLEVPIKSLTQLTAFGKPHAPPFLSS